MKIQISRPKSQITRKKRTLSVWSLRLQPGFTLVETLVVMLVLVTIGSIILSIFIIALTGTTKSHTQQILRENGNYAISQISKTIKYAKSFNYVSLVADPNDPNFYAETVCAPQERPVKYKAISIASFDSGDVVFACEDVNNLYTLASSDKPLLNTDKVSLNKDNEDSCYFTCTRESIADPPTIGIHFELSPKNIKDITIPFETSVVLRNE